LPALLQTQQKGCENLKEKSKSEAADLAEVLGMLAQASSAGDKTGMMSAAKLASERIRALSKKLRETSKKNARKNFIRKERTRSCHPMGGSIR